jgi:hypothetical protein
MISCGHAERGSDRAVEALPETRNPARILIREDPLRNAPRGVYLLQEDLCTLLGCKSRLMAGNQLRFSGGASITVKM